MTSAPEWDSPGSANAAGTKADREGPSGLLIMAFVGVFMLVGILFLAWLGTPRLEPTVGKRLERLDLSPIAFADAPFSEKDLQGKLTLLHFWGTWCPECREEFPEFVKLAEAFQGNDAVQVVSVSSSQGPEYNLDQLTESTKAFLESSSAKVPTYADPAGLSRMQAAMLLPEGFLTYPSTFLVDRSGVVVGVWVGFRHGDMQQVAMQLRSLL